MRDVIVTLPPYATFRDAVANHPVVSGLRLNTVMPTGKDALEDILKKYQDTGKDIWIDLKARQLRVKTFGVPPFTEIELTHNIKVNTPTLAYFHDGQEAARVLKVDGNKLIMEDGPRRVVGPGESINIPDASLTIDGFLTDTDKRYVEAAQKVGINTYMLSFVESQRDIDAFKQLVPNATIASKIESRLGVTYANNWKTYKQTTPDAIANCRLMTARGDLFVELKQPHQITTVAENIVRQDPNAIVASRILPSLAYSGTPSCADIGDVDNLLRMGYKTLMLGDEICQKKESAMNALHVLHAMIEDGMYNL